MEKLERIIKTFPPFDKRSKDPNKNYGVGAMIVKYYVKGSKGAIQFVISTGAYLKHVVQDWANTDKLCYSDGEIMGGYLRAFDISYHSPKPMYEGQKPIDTECEFTNGVCYYDGSTLQAEQPLEIYLQHGEDKLWEYLEIEYNYRFNKERKENDNN